MYDSDQAQIEIGLYGFLSISRSHQPRFMADNAWSACFEMHQTIPQLILHTTSFKTKKHARICTTD